MPLCDVEVLIKTFLRDPFLFKVVSDIQETLPEVKMSIADDGPCTDEKEKLYTGLENSGHTTIPCFYDAGFGYKSNRLVKELTRSYALIASDDFDFAPPEVKQGIKDMVKVLDEHPDIHICSGRVNNQRYEYDLLDEGSVVREKTIRPHRKVLPYFKCDLTVNYSLIRKEVFEKVRWFDDVKIGGGEHGSFFVSVKRAGFNVVCVSSANINEMTWAEFPVYSEYRGRAKNLERPCFDRIGISEWICPDGSYDYRKV